MSKLKYGRAELPSAQCILQQAQSMYHTHSKISACRIALTIKSTK